MPAIVEFPQVVRDALSDFGDLFACEPQRRHFAEYLAGLMVASNKTVTGINSEFAETTDQSCLNRFLTEVDWDEQALNERRLELLQHDPSTRYDEKGVIAIDNVLIDHDGKLIEDVGWFWDHAETFHRDGKRELGLGDCQLRNGRGQTRHTYLVMLAYSLLMSQLKQHHAKDWALRRLTTIGEACRAMTTETLHTTLQWAIEKVTQDSQKLNHVFAQLGLT